jgi:hypothetical protein
MNATHLLLWTGLLASAFGPPPSQEKKQDDKKGERFVSRFFDAQIEAIAKEIEGSWTLFDFTDPTEVVVDDQASGFATFHDGFLTLVLAMDSYEQSAFGYRDFLALDAGLYRYRFDERASLQLASVMSFTNETDTGRLERERSGRAVEYLASIDEGVLELRDPDGLMFSFRKMTSGEFPESAIRKLDRRRSGTEQWEDDEEDGR